jgi:peptidyl-prolyl cis-trans isomerase D
MFNLFRSRDKLVRITLGAVLTVVAVTMVVTLIPGFGTTTGSTDDPVLAQIGSEKIMASQAQRDFQTIVQGQQIPTEMLQVYFPQYFESTVMQKAVKYQAERMGLTVSDDEVLAGLMAADPQFFQNGQLVSKDQFVAFLAQRGVTLDQAIDAIRTDLLVRKLRDVVLESIVVSPREVENAFKRKYEKAKIQYIAFPPAKFMDQVKPTEQELQQSFNANRSNYTIPQKNSFQVVWLEQDKVEATMVISEQQLRNAYSASLDNFRMPERIHVRHILISTEGKSDAEKKTLKEKAEDVLKQAKGGSDFVALAKKYSDDKANADKGGDLDWVVKGQMVPEFEAAAFALKPKEISGVVTTQFGYHIIQMLDREPARVKPFEEVKDGLASDLRKQAVTDKMQMLGDQIRAALEKNPTSAVEVAKQFGAEISTVTNATSGSPIPGLGNSPEIEGALASMNKAGDVSQVLVLPANRLAVVVLTSKQPGRAAEFSEVADQVKQTVTNAKAQELALAKAKEAAERLKAGEDIEKVAKSYKLDVTTTNMFIRDDAVEGLGSAVYVEDAFSKPVGSILGPTLIQGRNVVSKVIGREEPDPSLLAGERESIVLKLKQDKAQERNALFMDSVFSKLAAEGKAKMYPDAIARVTASYREK